MIVHELQSTPLPGLTLLPDPHQDKAGYVVRRHGVSSPEQRAEEIWKKRSAARLRNVNTWNGKYENERREDATGL